MSSELKGLRYKFTWSIIETGFLSYKSRVVFFEKPMKNGKHIRKDAPWYCKPTESLRSKSLVTRAQPEWGIPSWSLHQFGTVFWTRKGTMAKISTIFSDFKPSQEKLFHDISTKALYEMEIASTFSVRNRIRFQPQEPWSGVSNAIPDATWHIDRLNLTGEPTWAHWKKIFLNGPQKVLVETFWLVYFLLFCRTASFNSICKRQKLKHVGLWREHMHHAIILGRSISSGESVSVFILGLFLGLFVSVSNVCLYLLSQIRHTSWEQLFVPNLVPQILATYRPWDFSNCVLFVGGLAMACLTCSISTKNAVACGIDGHMLAGRW